MYRSSRVEHLLEALAEVVAVPLGDPLRAETIVVSSRAMAGWLTMRLSERFGSWAAASFPFPRRFVQDAFGAVLGPRADAMAAWQVERLTWAVLGELPRHLRTPPFDPLRRFLDADPRPHGRYELAARIAGAFDQYAVFRPEMVLRWQAGRDDDWQAILWRALVARLGDGHAAGLARAFFDALTSASLDPAMLPERVCVFGVSTLPPFYIRVLSAIASRRPVHAFVLSPSIEYWAEIRSHREALRAAMREPDRVAPPALDDLGNPLLASFGAIGRDFQRVLEAEVDYEEPEQPTPPADPPTTMLAVLQDDVLRLRHRGGRDATIAALSIAPQDDSIRIHACHSPMREVEVLHDQLLALVHEHGVMPHEIVVLTPDIDVYAPLVEAAFERDRGGPTHVPYAIADRPARRESPVLEALLRALSLVGGRATASEVLDLLALDVVRRRFELTPEEYDRIAEWVVDAGIRWGIDEADRHAHGQPRYDENTWRFGLRRLLLGYALPTQGRETYGGVLPFDEIEGTDAIVLGKLAEFCGVLFARLRALASPRPLPAWRDAISEVLDALLSGGDGDAAWEHQQIRATLDALATESRDAGFEDDVALTTIRACLERHLDDDRPTGGLFSGGITFCELLPLRSLPYRVVCLLGMSDGAFPRPSRTVGFDRIAADPRPGDRSRRADDRYMFLEALLSARERLVITYVGRSIQDNARLPPSVVVSELLDVIAESFVAPELDARAHVVVEHPMQPFSPRYFGTDPDPRLFSYAQPWEEGARAYAGRRSDATSVPLLVAPLPSPPARRELALDEIVRFFRLPAAQLLKRRLGVDLDDYARERSDREPMELDSLDEWKAGDAILQHRMEGIPAHQSLRLLRARGILPLGVPGDCRFAELAAIADPIARTAAIVRTGGRRPDLDVDVEIAGTRLVGRVRDRWPRATIVAQFGRIGAKHRLALWIRHLVVCLLDPEGSRVSAIVGRSEKTGGAQMCQLFPVDDAATHLATIVDLYHKGQCEPLLLFPRSSLAYAQESTPSEAMIAARGQWFQRNNPERNDPHLLRIFGESDPLAPGFSLFPGHATAGDFATLARAVFGPMLAHEEKA